MELGKGARPSSGALHGARKYKPIRLIGPFPPVGGTDNDARAVVAKAAQILGQTLYAKTGFDPIKNFTPITRFSIIPAMLVVSHGRIGNSTACAEVWHALGTSERRRNLVFDPPKPWGGSPAGLRRALRPQRAQARPQALQNAGLPRYQLTR